MIGNSSPSPQGREDESFRKSHGMKTYKNLKHLFSNFAFLLVHLVSFCFSLWFIIFFLIVIPEDILNQEFLQTRDLCKFSTEFLGCWTNHIVHTSVTVRFIIHYDGANGNRQCQAIFANVTETLHKISLAASPHHLAKCVICIFAKFVCFSRIRENTKTRKMSFSRICKIVKNSKKFSYTWFISPRIIYCLVPRQPPIWGGWGYTHGGPVTKSTHFSWRGDLLNLDCTHFVYITFFINLLFIKIIFIKFIF